MVDVATSTCCFHILYIHRLGLEEGPAYRSFWVNGGIIVLGLVGWVVYNLSDAIELNRHLLTK